MDPCQEVWTPYYFFVPKDSSFDAEFSLFTKITEAMPVNSTGILTARDHFVIDFDDEPLLERIRTFLDPRFDDREVGELLGISENYAWRISAARESLSAEGELAKLIRNLHYRPFDARRVLYHPAVVWRTRKEVMRHLACADGFRNLALITSRMTKGEEFAHALVSRDLIEVISISPKTSNNAFVYPLFLENDNELLSTTEARQISHLPSSRIWQADSGLPRYYRTTCQPA